MRALRNDSGAAAAETAIIMVVVSALLALLAGTGTMMINQARLSEGARTVAREVMRGEDFGVAQDAGAAIAGEGAQFTVTQNGDFATVTGSREVSLTGPIVLHTFTLTAEARTRIEPHLVGAP